MELSSSSRYHPQLLHSNQPFREKAGEKAERHVDYKQFLFLSSDTIFILITAYNYNLGIEVMKTKKKKDFVIYGGKGYMVSSKMSLLNSENVRSHRSITD